MEKSDDASRYINITRLFSPTGRRPFLSMHASRYHDLVHAAHISIPPCLRPCPPFPPFSYILFYSMMLVHETIYALHITSISRTDYTIVLYAVR